MEALKKAGFPLEDSSAKGLMLKISIRPLIGAFPRKSAIPGSHKNTLPISMTKLTHQKQPLAAYQMEVIYGLSAI